MREPVKTGMESIIGKHGYVVETIFPLGIIQVAGEQWGAISENEVMINEGESIEVTGKQGINLIVRKI